MNFEKWKNEILKITDRSNEKEFENFIDLVEQVKGNENIDVLRILIQTFSNKDDYGSQARVNTYLGRFEPELVAKVLVEELSFLEKNASKWIPCLIGDELQENSVFLLKALNNSNKNIRKIFKKFVNTPDFIEDFPQVLDILNNLKD